MSKPSVARGKVVRLHPADPGEPVTLADVMITWQEGDETKTATGAQIARLLTLASEEAPTGYFAQGDVAGIGILLLRGLSDLVFPDPRSLDDLGPDTRFFVSETLGHIAARIATEALDHANRPRAFTVRVERGTGLRNHSKDPVKAETSR